MALKVSDEQMAVLRDLGEHAGQKAHTAIRDACQLINDDQLAYSLAMNVIASMICTAARMLPGRKTHVAKIAVALRHLTELLAHHRDHGDHC